MVQNINPETTGSVFQAPVWLEEQEYPFTHRFMKMPAGNLHYVDEGKGEVLLFVHGTPSWSFLYRNFIRELSGEYRCVAVDHLGFGLSDKPGDFGGTPQEHAENLHEFIRRKDLWDITLVVHDFGGPIGLGSALMEPGRVKRVVLFNSWLWGTKEDPMVQKIDGLVNNWLGKFLYLNMNFSAKWLIKQGVADAGNLPRAIHQQYIKVFPTRASRQGPLKIARSLAGASDWYQEQWEKLDALVAKPWLLLWGTEDKFISTAYLDKWRERLPNATVKTLASGHFVQEEKAKEAIEWIRMFLGEELGPT